MKICLVSAFPPSHGGLSEYAFHIARELQKSPYVNLTVLADELPDNRPELEEFSVERCWAFDDPGSLKKLWGRIRKVDPDVVWFNLIFSTFGRDPLAAFAGLMLPSLTRLSGIYTHVTLHHLMEGVHLGDAGVRFPGLYRAAGAVATKILLASNSVSVLIPGYRRILVDKYGGSNVHVRPHGILSQCPEHPDFTKRNNPAQRILAFGKWGTYKKLEPVVEAFNMVSARFPDAKLVLAGGDHPNVPGYVESVARRLAGDPRIEFTGYVPEEDIPELFRTASIAVMPYSSSGGASGVAHIACTYGVPIVSADLGDFRDMAEAERLAIDFYPAGNVRELASRLGDLLGSEEKQREMAQKNFAAALRMTMPQIAYRYLRHFDLERRTKALKRISRLRKLPAWLPSRNFFSGTFGRDYSASIYPGDLFRPPANAHTGTLLNGDRFGGGSLDAAGDGVDHDTVSTRNGSNGKGILHWGTTSAARSQQKNHPSNGASHDLAIDTALAHFSSSDQPNQTEGEQSKGVGARFPMPMAVPQSSNGHGHTGNGKVGSHRGGPGNGAGERASHPLRKVRTGESDGTVDLPSPRDQGDMDVA
jgi:glycosyltransferase involved in cell wall biosynthesis